MDEFKVQNDLDLNKAFEIIISIESFNKYILDIAELIYEEKLSRACFNEVLDRYKVDKEGIKPELIDLILVYLNIVLNDHIISEKEKRNAEMLKLFFNLKEGDFCKYRNQEIGYILKRQFDYHAADYGFSNEEEIQEFLLQDLFDLGFDQFNEFKILAIESTIENGEDSEPNGLKDFKKNRVVRNSNARLIPQKVKDQVWNRDSGRCVLCGSTDKLEFDHLIPFTKGGSNTYRNIQLLCEKCNREKSDCL